MIGEAPKGSSDRLATSSAALRSFLLRPVTGRRESSRTVDGYGNHRATAVNVALSLAPEGLPGLRTAIMMRQGRRRMERVLTTGSYQYLAS